MPQVKYCSKCKLPVMDVFKDNKICKCLRVRPAPPKRQGFTLAELLVTMAIVGVIAALAIPAILDTKPKSDNPHKEEHHNSQYNDRIFNGE